MKKTASSTTSFARSAFAKGFVVASAAALCATRQPSFSTPHATPAPAWLRLQPGVVARVDLAPWRAYDEPEAALTASAASMQRDFTVTGARPGDIVYRPVGVRVRVVRRIAGRDAVVAVRGLHGGWLAYTQANRLSPEIPLGTKLVVAGGFDGFADFFTALTTPHDGARRVTTGTPLIALGIAAAPFDPDASDLIRVHVRVASGPLQGREGWIGAAYTGIPRTSTAAGATQIEKTCSCLPVSFE